VNEASYSIAGNGLSRGAYKKYDAALMKTRWGRRSQQRVALVDGSRTLASARQYTYAGTLDGRPLRICGIGDLFTDAAHRGRGHGRALLDRLIEEAAREGAEMVLLFSTIGTAYYERHGFESIPTPQLTLEVTESPRYGAPMTMVRGGEERDLQAIQAMGRVRAVPYRFHLDRDEDLIQHAIARRRLLAGLGSPAALQLHFFIAEEGMTAAAYVVISAASGTWTLEECGDRDPSGARVGALLQALIAREPAERRPRIEGWLPPGFMPPQVKAASSQPAPEVMMVHTPGRASTRLNLGADDVLYWRSDLF
jgi:GNAT superfamily N-acetyltransferase